MVENKYFFLAVLIGSILLFLGIIIVIIFILMEKKEDWRDYDCYILSIFWPPASCYNKEGNKEECYQRLKDLQIDNLFIIHGLWPTYLSGEYTDTCNPDDDISVTFNKDYEKNLSRVWPGLYSSDSYMWNHEYNKHGYCYIERLEKNPEKDYRIYFDKTLEMYIPNIQNILEIMLPDTSKGFHTITKEKFFSFASSSGLELEPDTYSLRCTENKERNLPMLSEIWLNYDLNMRVTYDLKLSDNCPDRFDIYFINETKIPVWQKYEFYVLSLVWVPTKCIDKGKTCYQEIKRRVYENKDNLNILNIHGLWPSYISGKFPQWCNVDKDMEIIKYTKDMDIYWMNSYEENEETEKEFWEHEYNKHGLCFNQRNNVSVDDYLYYFNTTIDIYKKYNLSNIMKDLFKGIFAGVTKIERVTVIKYLEEKYGNDTIALTCIQYNETFYLHEIRFLVNLTLQIDKIGSTVDDCPDFFNVELLEFEGPQEPDPNFYKTYDMYFYTILWLGTTCHMKGKQCYERIKNVPKNVFTVHGLWPNLRNGTLPKWCNGPNDIEIEIKDKELSDFMNKYYVSGYHTEPYFWGHEYNKHGYCFNQRLNYDVNDYEKFFIKSKEMFQQNYFDNLFIEFFKKEKIDIIKGDMAVNRTKFEKYFEERGFSKHHYVIVCTNIDNKEETIYNPHILEIRIRYDLNFNLLKNETDKSEFDCPETFYAQFL